MEKIYSELQWSSLIPALTFFNHVIYTNDVTAINLNKKDIAHTNLSEHYFLTLLRQKKEYSGGFEYANSYANLILKVKKIEWKFKLKN